MYDAWYICKRHYYSRPFCWLQATVVEAKVEEVLAKPERFGLSVPYDLVTMTPPYEEVVYKELMDALVRLPEFMNCSSPLRDMLAEGWLLWQQRSYITTRLVWEPLACVGSVQADAPFLGSAIRPANSVDFGLSCTNSCHLDKLARGERGHPDCCGVPC